MLEKNLEPSVEGSNYNNFFQYVGNATGSHPTTGFETTGFNFSAASPGYLGIQLGSGNYGWIHVDSISVDGLSYHIDGYAYEDSGDPITAGEAVPEPSSVALLAAGAAGIGLLRRQYKRT